jgi:hypothetical protein
MGQRTFECPDGGHVNAGGEEIRLSRNAAGPLPAGWSACDGDRSKDDRHDQGVTLKVYGYFHLARAGGAAARRRWRSRSAAPSGMSRTSGSSGSISASSLRRRPCRLNAVTGAFSSGAEAM